MWEYFYEEGNGSDSLGDDRKVMLAGTWTFSDNNLWSHTHHIGRINTRRCADSDAAEKYWYHEIGHGHTLGHRNDSGALMNPDSWTGFSLNSDETEQWRDCYSYSECGSSASTVEVTEHADEGVTEAEADELEEIESPTVVAKRPLPEEYRSDPIDPPVGLD